ncbi:MAG TPA: hypothetical protein VFG43_16965 [Geminicoccaceae bacterium]|nr:hypothetical protein [Geminicoccaceae bacterium]
MDRRRVLLAFGGTSLLAACAADPPPRPATPVAAGTLPPATPIRLDVGAVDVGEAHSPADAPTFIDKRRTQELVDASRGMLQAKIQATGGPGHARATIERASMVERPREVAGGVRGFFLRQPDIDLVGDLAVRLAVIGEGGTERAYATAEVNMSRGVLESTSIAERDRIAEQLVQDMLMQLERSLRQSVDEGLGDYRSS